METRLHLQPGQNGTKQLVQKYGDRLICVRYRYDTDTGQRHKTVELIEDTVPWRADNEPVLIKVAYEEREPRERVRQAGGRWKPEGYAWRLSYGETSRLGLLKRIVGDI